MCEFSFLLEPKWSSTTIVTRQNKIEPKVKVPSEEDHQEKFFFKKNVASCNFFFISSGMVSVQKGSKIRKKNSETFLCP